MSIIIIAPNLVSSLQKLYSKQISQLSPSSLSQQIQNKGFNKEQERILYHEAGHFLAGYLTGVTITEYDIYGDRDAGTSLTINLPNNNKLRYNRSNQANIDRSSSSRYGDNEVLSASRCGSLLIVAMAGMVAETLRFGTSKGGAEDYPTALAILQYYGISRRTYEASSSSNSSSGSSRSSSSSSSSSSGNNITSQRTIIFSDSDVDAYLRWAVLKSLVLLRLYRDELDILVDCMRNDGSIGDCIAAIEYQYRSSRSL